MEELINPFQTAFIKGRSLMDNFFTAHMLSHHLLSSGQQAVLFKIDFERAFDHINWTFLLELLRARGFGDRWISWIKMMLQSTSNAVLLNGIPGTFFYCKRGVRQGDPLSPLLFILCIDVLYRMLHEAVSNSLLPPIGVGDIDIHTLQFADDLLIFFDGSSNSAKIIKVVLEAFSEASGLRINFTKSRIIPVNLESGQANSIASLFGCSIEEFPFTYLGLPLSPRMPRKADFIPLIEKIGKRLAGWKGRLLSRAGRLVLINSVLSSVPTFFCSAFRLPSWVIKAIDRIRRGFLWKGEASTSGFHCQVNWNQVCRPKRVGGLGIRNLRAANSALLMKGLWNFHKATNLPWVRMMHRKHYRRRLLDADGVTPAKCAPLWKGILSTSGPFFASVSTKLGDGESTPFWQARWAGDITMRTSFPNLFKIASHRHSSVKRWMQRLASRDNFGFSNIPAHDNVGNRELSSFSTIIRSITTNSDKDELVWRWNDKGNFSASSAYSFLAFDGVDDCRIPCLWRIKIPPRTKLFLWLAARNRLTTADRLSKKGWLGPSICVCCCSDGENLEHLFFLCSFARRVWRKTFQGNHLLLTTLLKDPGDLASRWRRVLRLANRSEQDHLNVRLAATCWILWMERNHRIFDNQTTSSCECGRRIDNIVTQWNGLPRG